MAIDLRSRQLRREVRHWLAAEAEGRTDAAELALARALRSLPAVPLPAGFAVRVLQRAGIALPAPDFFARGWVRGAIGSAFLVAASLAALLPGLMLQAGGSLTPERLALAAHGAVTLLGRGLAGGVTLLHDVFDLGGLLLGVVGSPGFATLLATLTLLTLGALRLVAELTHDHGGRRHAEPI